MPRLRNHQIERIFYPFIRRKKRVALFMQRSDKIAESKVSILFLFFFPFSWFILWWKFQQVSHLQHSCRISIQFIKIFHSHVFEFNIKLFTCCVLNAINKYIGAPKMFPISFRKLSFLFLFWEGEIRFVIVIHREYDKISDAKAQLCFFRTVPENQ